MAGETTVNGELSGHREVEISRDNSAKISGLTMKVSDLEQENDKINQQKKEYKQLIEELEDSIKVLSNGNDEFKKQVNKVETENKALGAVVARVAELEADVSRLQHDLVSTMSDLQETTTELSDMRSEMAGIKQREEEKDVKSEAVEKEMNLLVSKVENLEGVESSTWNELEGKEREIGDLKKRVVELETIVGSSKNLEKLKNDLEKAVEKMKVEISVLESCLDEKEKMIREYEVKDHDSLTRLEEEVHMQRDQKTAYHHQAISFMNYMVDFTLVLAQRLPAQSPDDIPFPPPPVWPPYYPNADEGAGDDH